MGSLAQVSLLMGLLFTSSSRAGSDNSVKNSPKIREVHSGSGDRIHNKTVLMPLETIPEQGLVSLDNEMFKVLDPGLPKHLLDFHQKYKDKIEDIPDQDLKVRVSRLMDSQIENFLYTELAPLVAKFKKIRREEDEKKSTENSTALKMFYPVGYKAITMANVLLVLGAIVFGMVFGAFVTSQLRRPLLVSSKLEQ